jgi:hypothetical protein
MFATFDKWSLESSTVEEQTLTDSLYSCSRKVTILEFDTEADLWAYFEQRRLEVHSVWHLKQGFVVCEQMELREVF